MDVRVVEDDLYDAPRDLAKEVYNRIKQELREGKLRAGMRVTEAELCKRFSMSRTPIREAIYQLERDGLVSHEARRGLIVTRLDHQMISELYIMRENEEALAASLAAQHASEIEITALGELVAAENDEMAAGRSTNQLNQRIHSLIAAAAHNRFLSRNLDMLNGTLCLLPTLLESAERALEAHHEHVQILEAIRSRDPEAAGRATRTHIRSAFRLRLREYVRNQTMDEG